MSDIASLEASLLSDIAAAADEPAIEAVRVAALGKKGSVSDLLKTLGSMSPEERQTMGPAINGLKNRIAEALAGRKAELKDAATAARLAAETVDVTLPVRQSQAERGRIHPISQVIDEIAAIFGDLGFSIAEGPDIETDYYNFTALNFPEGHPAREMHDTFFFNPGENGERRLLRTHTSPVQIRTMLARRPPLRVIIPGRVYRHDNDLRHSPMFHQVEGLAVAEGIRFSDLKGTLEAFLHRLFSPETGVRLRPSFFPFTEPSCEVDITCPFCRGGGCATCSGTGWMEILGAGMVDPRVLANCGVDPDRYSGFAFGLGLDRVAMIRFGVPNIRLLFENDERLLRQVGIR